MKYTIFLLAGVMLFYVFERPADESLTGRSYDYRTRRASRWTAALRGLSAKPLASRSSGTTSILISLKWKMFLW